MASDATTVAISARIPRRRRSAVPVLPVHSTSTWRSSSLAPRSWLIIARVCQRFPPRLGENADLQGYANLTLTQGTPSQPASLPFLSKKRKAEDEILRPDQTDRHSQARSDPLHIKDALQLLDQLVQISDAWKQHRQMLEIVLASSSPPQPTLPSTTTAPSSPDPAVPGVPSNTTLPLNISSNATIPYRYPEDALSSSPTNPPRPTTRDLTSLIPEADSDRIEVYVSGVVVRESDVPPKFYSSSPALASSNRPQARSGSPLPLISLSYSLNAPW